MYELREYQEDCTKVILDTTADDPSLIVLATGGGKTVIMAKVVSQVKGRVCILVPSTELRLQTIEKIHRLDPEIDIGSVQAQKHKDYANRVVVSSRASMAHKTGGHRRIKSMLEHGDFEMIIIDECHDGFDQSKKVIKAFNPDIKVVGLTATPWQKSVVNYFKKPKYTKNVVEMIIDGYLIDPDCIRVDTETDLGNVGISSTGDFNQDELDEAIINDERNEIIVKAYKDHASDRRSTLVFANTKAHIKSIVAAFTEAGIECKGLDSDVHKDIRKEMIDDFKSGKLPILVNCRVLTTGFDYERLDCLMFCSPTKSKILYAQCLGRGLRIHEEKDSCLVIDIVDVAKNHDICDVNTIFDLKIENGGGVKKAVKKVEEEKAMLEAEKIKVEEEERKKREEELKLKVTSINLFNTDMIKSFQSNPYDWWKVDITTQALTFRSNHHYIIECVNNTYVLYETTTDKDNRTIKYIEESISLDELIEYVEDDLLSLSFNHNLFVTKDADFKLKPASPAQLAHAKHAKTNWDANKYFCAYNIKNLIKNYKMDQVM